MRLRLRAVLTAALCVGSLAACSDITNPNGQSAGGTYDLQTVNGSQLPYTFSTGGATVSVQSDVYTLTNNYSYSEVTTETVSNGFQNSNVTQTEYGNWSQNNNAITFTPTTSTQGSFTPYTGSLSGGGLLGGGANLTIAINGTVSIYSAR